MRIELRSGRAGGRLSRRNFDPPNLHPMARRVNLPYIAQAVNMRGQDNRYESTAAAAEESGLKTDTAQMEFLLVLAIHAPYPVGLAKRCHAICLPHHSLPRIQ